MGVEKDSYVLEIRHSDAVIINQFAKLEVIAEIEFADAMARRDGAAAAEAAARWERASNMISD